MRSMRLASRSPSAHPDPSDDLYRALWDANADACLVANAEGTIILANPAVLDVLCYLPERMLGRHLSEVRCVLPGTRDDSVSPYAPGCLVTVPPTPNGLRATATRGDGREIAVDVSFASVELDGACVRVARFRDATALQQVEQELADACIRARSVLASLPDGMLATDRNGLVTHINETGAALAGLNAAAAIGLPWCEVVRLVDDAPGADARDPVALAVFSGQHTVFGGMAVLLRRGGEVFPIEGSVVPIAGAGGHAQGAVLLFRDASLARRTLVELRHRAVHDGLTGLLNRDEFLCRLHSTVASNASSPAPCRLMYFDLQAFALVNRNHGHATGDALLRQLALALRAPLPKGSPLARFGSDCFVLLLRQETREALDRIDARVRQSIAEVSSLWRDRRTPVTVSVGSVDFGTDALGALQLVAAAHQACLDTRKGRVPPQVAWSPVFVPHSSLDRCARLPQDAAPPPDLADAPAVDPLAEDRSSIQA